MSDKRPNQGPMRPPMPMARGHGNMARMGMPVEKPKHFRKTLRRLLTYFRPHAVRLCIVFLAAILSTVFSILSPKVMGNATTDLVRGIVRHVHGATLLGGELQPIVRILVELVVLYLFSALFSYVQQYLMAGVAQSTVYTLRQQVYQKLSRLPLSYFDTHSHGDLMSRFVNDFDNIGNTLQQTVTQLITSLITFVGVIIMMLTISPWMTLVIFATLPLSFLVTRMIASRSLRHFKGQQRALGQLNGHVEEMYTGHSVVKAFGRESHSIERFNEYNEQLYASGWKAQFISGMIFPLMNFIGNIGYVLVSVIGGILVMRRAIQIGDIQAFIQYARQFSQPITQLSSISNVVQSTIASAERIFELMDAPEERQDDADAQTLTEAKGEVQFQHVSFRYQEDVPLIEDLHIDVASGQTVAIVGPTGAGKTTLVNLLMRFYEVGEGAITIDGHNISRLRRGNLRNLFGMVLQDTWLFKGTIFDNIAYGRPGAPRDEVIQAAKAAYADHFIRTLPDGYDTVLNEDASNISQGQRQLLTIARALLANPAILILDEATSNVDTRTEVLIQRAMSDLMKGRTSFVIAHRLSTIRDADTILVMNQGRVIEQGTHRELLAAQGFYAELYNSQFASVVEFPTTETLSS